MFYLEVCFSHPINDRAFLKITKKAYLCRNQFTVSFDEKEQNSYFPNVVALPLTDFQVNVSVLEFGKPANRTKYTKYIALRNIKDRKNIKVQCE